MRNPVSAADRPMWSDAPPTDGDLDTGRCVFRRRSDIPAIAEKLAPLCLQTDLVALGLNELMLNAIEHGVLGIGYARKRALIESGRWLAEIDHLESAAASLKSPRDVVLQYRRINELTCFTIRDPGAGFDWRSYMSLDPLRSDAPNGRGIAIARLLCFDSLCYREEGREVEVIALAA